MKKLRQCQRNNILVLVSGGCQLIRIVTQEVRVPSKEYQIIPLPDNRKWALI